MTFRFPVGPFSLGDPGSAYNGFSWEDRCAVTPLQRAATQRGDIEQPKVCGITSFSCPEDPRRQGYIFQHNEDYGRPLAFYAVSRTVHAALHARFTNPLNWFGLVRRHYAHGAWFTFLTMDPADMSRPFEQVYPLGLPADGVLWPGLASELRLSPERYPDTLDRARAQDLKAYSLFQSAGAASRL